MRLFVLATAAATVLPVVSAQTVSPKDWPSFNRTLDGKRYAPQAEITPANAAALKEVCRYDLHQQTSLQTGPVVLGGVMYVTTGHDTIALDAETCAEKWRAHEDYVPAYPNDVNRGAAVVNGRVIRGTQDGRVLAYDAATGKKLWDVTVADKAVGETTPSAVLAWKGLVFTGNAGINKFPVKGRMLALDAATGKIVWEQYMVPRGPEDKGRGPAAPVPAVKGTAEEGGTPWTAFTLDEATGTLYVPGGDPIGKDGSSYTVAMDAKTGAIKKTYGPVKHDFHDWEVSASATLYSVGAKKMVVAPTKDGRMYAADLASGRVVWTAMTTTVQNESAPLTNTPVHFCPGMQGGNEWNGAAYSPLTKMVYNGAVDWCATVAPAVGKAEPKGTMDAPATGTGWITAVDAATGKGAWKFHTPSPVLAAVTPTAGGVLFAGDLAGNFYVFNAATGAIEWKTDVGGSLAGGVVSYASTTGAQRVAVAAGMKSNVWPMAKGGAQIVVYGLK